MAKWSYKPNRKWTPLMNNAIRLAVNDTMTDGIREFTGNHPGWQNITGDAERSVRILQTARKIGSGIGGEWGSAGIVYFRRLEFEHGRALQMAADRAYDRLPDHLRNRIRGMG